MCNIIMSKSNLEDISLRLAGCNALVDTLCETAGVSTISEAALSGVSDLLEMIRRDFQAGIDGAEDFAEMEVKRA